MQRKKKQQSKTTKSSQIKRRAQSACNSLSAAACQSLPRVSLGLIQPLFKPLMWHRFTVHPNCLLTLTDCSNALCRSYFILPPYHFRMSFSLSMTHWSWYEELQQPYLGEYSSSYSWDNYLISDTHKCQAETPSLTYSTTYKKKGVITSDYFCR